MKVIKATHVLVPHLLSCRDNWRRAASPFARKFWRGQVSKVILKIRSSHES